MLTAKSFEFDLQQPPLVYSHEALNVSCKLFRYLYIHQGTCGRIYFYYLVITVLPLHQNNSIVIVTFIISLYSVVYTEDDSSLNRLQVGCEKMRPTNDNVRIYLPKP
jgi:hypothetical protein